MKRDAAWLLRRYRDGGAPDWRVKQILERELNRLIQERYEFRAEVDELRRSAPDRLRSFDEATDRALQWMAERRFESALPEIRQAAAELSELRRFVSVAAELEKAAALVEELEFHLGAGLTELTTPTVLRRLRDLAREFLDQGEGRKARFVVLLLGSEVDRLRSRERREPGPGRAMMLSDLAARGEAAAVEAIRKLIHMRYHHLAERLAEDLEADLTVKDRSRRASETPGGSLGPLIQDLKEIRQRAEAVSRSLAQWAAGAGPAGDA